MRTTYAVRGARTKTTGHYRRPGTRDLYCNRPAGIPNGDFTDLPGWKMCTTCVNGEARDRAEAEAVAAQHTEQAPAEDEPPAADLRIEQPRCRYHGADCDANPEHVHSYEATPAMRDAARAYNAHHDRRAAQIDALADLDQAVTRARTAAIAAVATRRAAALARRAELADTLAAIERAEADDGTWRGQWIGRRPTDATLFEIERAEAEQGALFA